MNWWVDELTKLGWSRMLADRLKFHGRLSVQEVSLQTGYSNITVNKHFRKLVDAGLAVWGRETAELGLVSIYQLKE